MAAGFVNITVYVGPSTTVAQTFRSSDGTSAGNLCPAVLLRDDAGNVVGNALGYPLYCTTNPIATPSANFIRPADTTAYASGDLVANSTTAGSVTPLSWATAGRISALGGSVRRARIKKSGTSTTNAQFRLHLYGASPTLTNGDNGVWLSTQSTYLGSIDVTLDKAFSNAAEGCGGPQSGTGSEINFVPTATTIYGLLEARAAYTPESGETFTVELEIAQN